MFVSSPLKARTLTTRELQMKTIPKANWLVITAGAVFSLMIVFKLFAAQNGFEMFMLGMALVCSGTSLWLCVKGMQYDLAPQHYRRHIVLLAGVIVFIAAIFNWLATLVRSQ